VCGDPWGWVTPAAACPVCDLALLLVIEGEANGIAKGHQGPLHGVGLRLPQSGIMGRHRSLPWLSPWRDRAGQRGQ
jgi:hypothetical protein